MHVLAIDQGTSSTKALVVDPGGRVVGEGVAPVSPRASEGGAAVEQDPLELLDSIVEAGGAAIAAAGHVPVAAIGLANQGETVLHWDRADGRPLGPAVSWQDRRAVGVTRELAGEAERLRKISGLPLDPYFAAPKMTWLRRRVGEGGVVTTVDAWLTHRLTGAFVTDAATASRTLLLDLDRCAWSQEACALFGIAPDELPEIADCAAGVGETTAFGTDPIPLAGLAVDQQAALFAESCFAPGEAKCTYGTGAFILAAAGEQPVRSEAHLAACVAWRLDGRASYCLDGQVYTAGTAVGWLARLGLIDGPEAIDPLVGTEPPSRDAALFVPGLAGLGAPLWAPHARGGWTGLSLATDRASLVRAVVWGIAAQIAELGAAMGADLGRPLDRLRVDGGLTRSAALMQAQADLLQVPVELYPSPDATALGVGALARLGAGGAASPVEAVGDWSPAAVFEPRMGADEAAERLARHRAAAEAHVRLADEAGS